jgi:proline dehydrogenase
MAELAWKLACWAGRRYIAGPGLADALRVCHQLAGQGTACTIGYWNAAGEAPAGVLAQYRAGVDALATQPVNGYLSLKAPALDFEPELVGRVLEHAGRECVRVHFDSHGPETVEHTMELIEGLSARAAALGCTLPGRWRRSVRDADWAVQHGLHVRVVKGQWVDLEAPELDHRQGFLAVIDRLAGRARHVAVATHDPPLADEALRRLRAAGTSCELELLFGLPMLRAAQAARGLEVPTRVYVPYGRAFVPYALGQVRRNPRLLLFLLRDVSASAATGLKAQRSRDGALCLS